MEIKRILHVVNKMGYGGIETFIMNIYRNIDKERVQFDFAVHTTEKGEYDEEIKKLGGNIYYFPSRRDDFYKYYQEWKRFLKNNSDKYSSIHMHVSSLTTILPIKLAKTYKISNRIIHAHSTLQSGKIHEIFSTINKRKVKKYANYLYACSEIAGDYVFGDNRFEIIKNGIDSEKYKIDIKTRKKIREQLNLEEELTIVNVGRFVESKNHKFLLEIFKKINEHKKDSFLILVGDGALRTEIEEKIKEINIEKNVKMVGNVNNVNEILQGCDVFVMPSIYEGLPVACIEAQAAGLKCIISNSISKETDITGLVEFVDLKDNADYWSKKILDSYQIKKDDTKQKIINAGYDIKNTCSLLEKIYTEEVI